MVPIDVSTLSGAVIDAGISVVIFIFGGCAAKAVAMLPAITPAETSVVNSLVFIGSSPNCFGEANSSPLHRTFVLSKLLHQFKITGLPGLIKPGL